MQKQNENYESNPDFIIENIELNNDSEIEPETVEPESEPVPLKINAKIVDFSEKEQKLIKYNLSGPSALKVQLPQTLVDFESYKGEIPELFKYLSSFFQLINNWNEDTPLTLSENLFGDINVLLNKIAYISNNKYLGNVMEVLAVCLENGNFELGSVMDTEIIFQGFKRVYNQRVQAILFPLLFVGYNLHNKLLPIKKIAWQLLNKNARNFEAALIMDDIQKGNIRAKKSRELLVQEGYDFEKKFECNIDLLIVLTGKHNVFYPIYKACKESMNNPEINIESYLLGAYELEKVTIRPLSQQLLTYKTGRIAETITKGIMRWAGKNSEPQFKQYLFECYREFLFQEHISNKNFQMYIREIIFATMEMAKKRSWPAIEVIKDMTFALLSAVNMNDINKLKLISYYLGTEVISGVLKIKYKIEEAVQGLAKGIVYLVPSSIECENNPGGTISGGLNKKALFTNKLFFKIISEYIYSGLWDTALEIYPNIQTVEKYAALFEATMKSETQGLKLYLQGEEYKVFERNTSFSES